MVGPSEFVVGDWIDAPVAEVDAVELDRGQRQKAPEAYSELSNLRDMTRGGCGWYSAGTSWHPGDIHQLSNDRRSRHYAFVRYGS